MSPRPGPAADVAAARTLPELLAARARATPGVEALRFEGRGLSFRALHEGAGRLADALGRAGVRAGERVALMLPNGLDLPLAWLALPLLRAVAVPVHPGYGEDDLAHVLAHSGAGLVVAGEAECARVERVRERCPRVVRVLTLADGVLEGARDPGQGTREPRPGALPSDPGEPTTIQYTSGTTGLPKGCVLHHGYWLRLARTMQASLRLGADDVLLTAQPQTYMDPSWNLVLALLAGAPLVVLPRFSASTFWADVRAAGATFFYCIGTMPLYLAKRPPDPELDRGHRVRLVYCSGIPPARHAEFERRWGCTWRETYGTTELGVVLLAPPEDEGSVGSGGMGAPVDGREIRVVNERGRVVPDGTPGELLVRGPDLMLGYHDDPAATAAWCPDGWARTGDVVVRRGPAGPALVGRRKDMIRRAGENVSAVEVEEVLARHPAVRAAACIPVPDELRGEEIKAYVVPVEGGSVIPAEVHAFAAARLARFKVPRFIEVVTALPLTPSAKVAKAELVRARRDHRAGAWDAEAAAASEPADADRAGGAR